MSRRSHGWRFAGLAPYLLLLPSVGLAANCALGGFNRVELTDAGVPDAGTGSGGGDDGCEHASYPPPPDVTDAGGDEEVVAAVHLVRLAEQSDGGALGVDLDNICTCFEGAGPSCTPPKDGTDNDRHCDGNGGRDNSFGGLFASLSLALGGGDVAETFTDNVDQGLWGLLIRVEHYNGKADDDRVKLSLYVSPGIGTPSVPPKWDGLDEWPITPTAVELDDTNMPDLDSPKYFDDNAYVSGGIVVATITNTEVLLAGTQSRFKFNVEQGGLIARIEDTPDGAALRDGVIMGRISTEALFEAISNFRDDNGNPLCTDSPFYGAGQSAFCVAQDMLIELGSPGQPCDALSWAMGFDADPANFGGFALPPVPAKSCPPETDPINDNCDHFKQ